jgi:radical SAM protein (TIGR01212 family)
LKKNSVRGPLPHTKIKYDSALIDDKIVGIFIATRPDCINEEIVKLLSTYSKKYYVCVELGLQTSNDNTGKIINRCYSSNDFTKAIELLNKYNIDVITHIMIGLPTEQRKDLENTIQFLNQHNIQGLKIHSTYIVKNTVLEKMYLNNQYTPITLENYLEDLVYVITHINPNIIIHRISGDAPKDTLVAPEWNTHKKLVLNGLDRILKENNLYQGMYFK